MRLENNLPKSYYSHSQSPKRLRSHAYTNKIKNYSNICSPSNIENIDNIEIPIALPSINLEYYCDLSSNSWGTNFDTQKVGGAWYMKEKAPY